MRESSKNSLPEDDKEREEFPMAEGLLDYFPNALAEVARHSKKAGDKHHPGERLHWERGKSTDHRNKIIRHLIDSGGKDKDGNRHSTGLAWRSLALLQEELEAEMGYPAPRNAIDPGPDKGAPEMQDSCYYCGGDILSGEGSFSYTALDKQIILCNDCTDD